jgi:hypothetical protein
MIQRGESPNLGRGGGVGDDPRGAGGGVSAARSSAFWAIAQGYFTRVAPLYGSPTGTESARRSQSPAARYRDSPRADQESGGGGNRPAKGARHRPDRRVRPPENACHHSHDVKRSTGGVEANAAVFAPDPPLA